MRKRILPLSIVGLILAGVAPAGAEGLEFNGRAEMGITGGSQVPRDGQVEFLSDLDLQIRLSRTTDSGLTFALEFDIDDLDVAGAPLDPAFPPRR